MHKDLIGWFYIVKLLGYIHYATIANNALTWEIFKGGIIRSWVSRCSILSLGVWGNLHIEIIVMRFMKVIISVGMKLGLKYRIPVVGACTKRGWLEERVTLGSNKLLSVTDCVRSLSPTLSPLSFIYLPSVYLIYPSTYKK